MTQIRVSETEWPGGSSTSDPVIEGAGQLHASQPAANCAVWETWSLAAGNKAVSSHLVINLSASYPGSDATSPSQGHDDMQHRATSRLQPQLRRRPPSSNVYPSGLPSISGKIGSWPQEWQRGQKPLNVQPEPDSQSHPWSYA